MGGKKKRSSKLGFCHCHSVGLFSFLFLTVEHLNFFLSNLVSLVANALFKKKKKKPYEQITPNPDLSTKKSHVKTNSAIELVPTQKRCVDLNRLIRKSVLRRLVHVVGDYVPTKRSSNAFKFRLTTAFVRS